MSHTGAVSTTDDPAEEPRGLVLDEGERPPRPSLVATAAAAGSVWGLLCYSILWEGEPLEVQRAFFESVAGTIALLPTRIVLWAIHLAETVAGRSFELSANHRWISVAAAIVGAVIAAAVAIAVRTLARRLRRPPGDASIPR